MSKNKKKPESQKRKKNENFYYNITCFNVPRTTQYKYVYISFIQKMNRKRKKKKKIIMDEQRGKKTKEKIFALAK